MNKRNLMLIIVLSLSFLGTTQLSGHCEIPCGIYDDEMRVNMLAEHITTLEKSMQQIIALRQAGDKNYNQLVRWINNKETHANEFQEIVTQYFMTQRIKPVDPDNHHYDEYLEKLTLLHAMLVEAMHCKQTTDLKNIEELRVLLKKFRAAYFK